MKDPAESQGRAWRGFFIEAPVTWDMPPVLVCEKALLEIIEGTMAINADNIAITRIFLVVIVM